MLLIRRWSVWRGAFVAPHWTLTSAKCFLCGAGNFQLFQVSEKCFQPKWLVINERWLIMAFVVGWRWRASAVNSQSRKFRARLAPPDAAKIRAIIVHNSLLLCDSAFLSKASFAALSCGCCEKLRTGFSFVACTKRRRRLCSRIARMEIQNYCIVTAHDD